MFRSGTRLTRDELRTAAPSVGHLIVEDWLENNAENRALRVARLRHPSIDYYPEILPPLFDPVVVRCNQRGMILAGIQIEAPAGSEKPVHLAQKWWLRLSG